MHQRCPSKPFITALSLLLSLAAGVCSAWAQDKSKDKDEEPKLGWSNATDLSLVITAGNASAQTLGLGEHLRYLWPTAGFEADVTGVHSVSTDDRFYLVQPGLEIKVGETPPNLPRTLVRPDPDDPVAKYQASGRYERTLAGRLFWDTGASWDRNEDAGILNRVTSFGGLGHNWINTKARHLATHYGLSYTNRKEEVRDPSKDRRFGGARLAWEYRDRFGVSKTSFDSTLVSIINLTDGSDASINTTNALTVPMTGHLSLKVSLQWLFENQPALETELDVIAYVTLVNPDGLAASGDEFFRTLESGGTKLLLGSENARREKLDTIVRTALVITF